jgi:DNA-nicking Smr family endonuclease
VTPKSPENEAEEFFPEPVRVADVLDLHGFFPEQVPEILEAFLENASALRFPTLRIVHGKGRSRMKFEVIRFLKTRPDVLRFRDAPPESGGWGATVVEMRVAGGEPAGQESR